MFITGCDDAVIVMATSVYFYSMNAQMKTLIDSICSRYTEITNKEFYFILAGTDNSRKAMAPALEGFRAFTSCLTGPKENGVIYGLGVTNIGDIKGSKAMEEAYEMGRKA
jgi:multimeric flavodoxin WrbA